MNVRLPTTYGRKGQRARSSVQINSPKPLSKDPEPSPRTSSPLSDPDSPPPPKQLQRRTLSAISSPNPRTITKNDGPSSPAVRVSARIRGISGVSKTVTSGAESSTSARPATKRTESRTTIDQLPTNDIIDSPSKGKGRVITSKLPDSKEPPKTDAESPTNSTTPRKSQQKRVPSRSVLEVEILSPRKKPQELSSITTTPKPRMKPVVEVEIVSPQRSRPSSSSTLKATTPRVGVKSNTPVRKSNIANSPILISRGAGSVANASVPLKSVAASPQKVSKSTARAKRPRDLSDLFRAEVPPIPPTASDSDSGPKKKRRMLGRTNTMPDMTLPSLSSQLNPPRTPSPTREQLTASPSPPQTPLGATSTSLGKSSSFPNISTHEKTASTPPPSTSALSSSRPSVRTYSQSRSFLVVLPPPSESTANFDAINEDSDMQDLHRESYADLRRRWRVDMSSDDGEDEGLMGPVDLKSITELRDKGENRRFLDEVDYMLEGLEPKVGLGMKRMSAIELLNHMSDIDFVRRLKAVDVLGHAWDVLRNSNIGVSDKILDMSLGIFAAFTMRDPRHAHELAQQEGLMDALQSLLAWSIDADPFGFEVGSERVEDARRLAIGKNERNLIEQIRTLIRKGSLIPDESPISTRKYVSQTLVALPSSIQQLSFVEPLRDSLLAELEALRTRTDAYLLGLPIFPTAAYDTSDLQHIDNCLRLLEGMLMSRRRDEVRELLTVKCSEIVKGLIGLCSACHVLLDDPDMVTASRASTCLISGLRILVKLGDSGVEWCQPISNDPTALSTILRFVCFDRFAPHSDTMELDSGNAQTDDREANNLDILCLALALLTSTVQQIETTRDNLSKTKLNPGCDLGRACTRDCHCTDRTNALECLVRTYLDLSSRSQANPEANFLRGHLAILLGLVCEGSASNQSVILAALPGDSTQGKLDSLISMIREFVSFYTDLSQRMARAIVGDAPGEDESDEDEAETQGSKLKDKVNPGTERGVEVANNVILFLETLRIP